MPEIKETIHLKDLWDDKKAQTMAGNQLDLLRYRSNLLGTDLRITNFGGGNTSSKMDLPDPFTGRSVRVLAVKGSGGDLGSIAESGFALLYRDRLEQLKDLYRGERYEDEMVRYYPLSAFGESRVAASIDTPPLITSTICIPIGPSPSRQAPTGSKSWRNSTRNSIAKSCGCRGSVPDSSWRS
jgi:hypothetical protein